MILRSYLFALVALFCLTAPVWAQDHMHHEMAATPTDTDPATVELNAAMSKMHADMMVRG